MLVFANLALLTLMSVTFADGSSFSPITVLASLRAATGSTDRIRVA
jgi:hypothetical protein